LRKIDGFVVNRTDAINAALDGRCLRKWICQKVIGTTNATVVSDAGSFYNLEEGDTVIVVEFTRGLATNSDTLKVAMGYTDQADCAGTFTALTHCYETNTGASNDGNIDIKDEFESPLVASYDRDGARSVCFRLQVNDTSATVSVEWAGYVLRR